eukprot:TRINITY_DN753_c0_g1_i1.p1 TRINITY_DN753_c0_g1~~TRINITY_DN753_c0_g1_i1.p1  ORF type:complete len:215 (-),score=30.90 TRINITY_DN753_c0_g1_i1:39-683(-)
MEEGNVHLEENQQNENQDKSWTGKIDKKIASRNWTWTLRILTFIAAGGMIAAGIIGFFNSQTPLGYIVLVYLILLGLVLLGVLVPYPAVWARVNVKWLPFLHTYRGRGAFQVLMGSLATGTAPTVNIFIGVGVVVIGLFHIILACWYKETLDQSAFKKHKLEQEVQQNQEAQYNSELGHQAVQAAWQNQPQTQFQPTPAYDPYAPNTSQYSYST